MCGLGFDLEALRAKITNIPKGVHTSFLAQMKNIFMLIYIYFHTVTKLEPYQYVQIQKNNLLY